MDRDVKSQPLAALSPPHPIPVCTWIGTETLSFFFLFFHCTGCFYCVSLLRPGKYCQSRRLFHCFSLFYPYQGSLFSFSPPFPVYLNFAQITKLLWSLACEQKSSLGWLGSLAEARRRPFGSSRNLSSGTDVR